MPERQSCCPINGSQRECIEKVVPETIVPESLSCSILGCLSVLHCACVVTSIWNVVASRNGKFFALAVFVKGGIAFVSRCFYIEIPVCGG